ncbi:phage/plasmid primase, P4 family [Pseudonocardia sp. NPDC049154]|uniref:DNA primase family protein n=1 Tax=Pseudonocardia sp. NPDC049154 TaxID=3155501 RepID=UPI0033EC54B1
MAAPIRQLFPDQGPPPEEAPNPTEVIPGPGDPLAVARIVLDEMTDDDGHLLLRRWRGEWWKYQGPQWVETDPEAIRKHLYERLEHAKYEKVVGGGINQRVELKGWAPDKGKVDKLIDAMAAPTLLSRDVEAPTWLSTRTSARGFVPCLNGLVDVDTQEIRPLTPDYFGTVGIPLEFNPEVGQPTEWLKFLRTLWKPVDGKDADEIRALQQWFGYVLSGRLDLQKMLLLVGPPRSGKSTIARILRDLIGEANTSAPTLALLAQNFGLETTIGKTLAIVGDARLQSQGQETVVERLLSISGQDTLTLDRKNRTAWTGVMQARIMMLSNELPRFGDASAAIASRFIILRLEESFLGREDTGLEDRLRAEFPAILKWALDGLADLNAKKRITEPAAHVEAMQELYDLVSPISAFIRDVCDTDDPDGTVLFDDLYRHYVRWAKDNGRGTAATAKFSADLKSRLPNYRMTRPTVNGVKSTKKYAKGITILPEWLEAVQAEDAMSGYVSGWGRGA